MSASVIPFTAPHRCSNPEALAFSTMFGIPSHLAEILSQLYAGNTIKIDRRHISALRTALEPETIDTMVTGYRLTPEGQTECQKAIAGFQKWARLA